MAKCLFGCLGPVFWLQQLQHNFFVSCALVSLSLSVTGKKRRKTKR